MSIPLIYCETNWLLALAFPHHQYHASATRLREAARNGNCRLMLPYASLLEAGRPINEESGRVMRSFMQIRDELARLAKNGYPTLQDLAERFANSKEVDGYARLRHDSIVSSVEGDTAVEKLNHISGILQIMPSLRSNVLLRGKDLVDFHILAAVLHHRRENQEGEAIFFSTNKNDFGNEDKIPKSVWDADKILWRRDFDIRSAIGAWRARFDAPGG